MSSLMVGLVVSASIQLLDSTGYGIVCCVALVQEMYPGTLAESIFLDYHVKHQI